MPPRPSPVIRALLVLLLGFAAGMGGCASVGGMRRCDDGQNDPFESFNRRVFAFDMQLDRTLIKPVAKAYRSALPEFVRDSIRTVVTNLKEPLVLVNDLLQGRGQTAFITGQRFVINTTVGLAGLTDWATRWGLPLQSGDFGQTLFAWGFNDGPYLVLPLLGPSNVRDAFGLGVDAYASPLGHVGSTDVRRDLSFSIAAADGLDLRARNIDSLDELERSSLDFYAFLRSVTRQQRHAVLRDARRTPDPPMLSGGDLVDPDAPVAQLTAEVPRANATEPSAASPRPADTSCGR